MCVWLTQPRGHCRQALNSRCQGGSHEPRPPGRPASGEPRPSGVRQLWPVPPQKEFLGWPVGTIVENDPSLLGLEDRTDSGGLGPSAPFLSLATRVLFLSIGAFLSTAP